MLDGVERAAGCALRVLVGAGDRRDQAPEGIDELARGAAKLLADALATARRACAAGMMLVRADSAYYG